MEDLTLSKTQINANGRPGQHIDDSLRSAVILSMQEKTNVKLTHNGKCYLVKYLDIIVAVNETGSIIDEESTNE